LGKGKKGKAGNLKGETGGQRSVTDKKKFLRSATLSRLQMEKKVSTRNFCRKISSLKNKKYSSRLTVG